MWKLLKSELIYNNKHLVSFYTVIMLVMIFLLATGYAEIRLLPGVSLVVFILIAITTGVRMGEDKRERFVSLIPLTPLQIALYRVLFFISIQGIMVLFWTIGLILRPPADLALEIIELSVLNGITLTITFLIFLWDDLGFFQKGMYRIYLLIFILILIAAMFFLRFLPSVFSPAENVHSVTEAVAVNLLWMSMGIFDIYIFTRRKSYLA